MPKPGLEAPGAVATKPATWYCVTGGNDIDWRVESPARAVGGKTVVLPENAIRMRGPDGRFRREPSAYFSVTQENDDTLFPWRVMVDRNDPDYMEIDYPEHEGAAIWTRPDFLRCKHAMAMQLQGIRTLSEADDNYLSAQKLNVFMRAYDMGVEAREHHMKAMAFMDGIVVSTRWLRDHYYGVMKKELGLKNIPDIFVCGNHVAAESWPERIERGDGPLRVGWMGSPSHVWDVDIAWPALMHARNLGCETWMVGYNPAKPKVTLDVPGMHESARSQMKIAQWRKVGFKHIEWRTPAQYERFPLPFDIGLCPLLTNTHTLGKSDIKALEYGIAGAAVIAQNNAVYNRSLVHGETALLVGGPQEMLEAVELLASDDELRLRLVANLQQYIREERNGDVMRKEWMEAING